MLKTLKAEGARTVFLRCGWCIKSFAWPMCLSQTTPTATTATTTQLFNIIKYIALSRMRIAFAFCILHSSIGSRRCDFYYFMESNAYRI